MKAQRVFRLKGMPVEGFHSCEGVVAGVDGDSEKWLRMAAK